jgi:hypothetical protein
LLLEEPFQAGALQVTTGISFMATRAAGIEDASARRLLRVQPCMTKELGQDRRIPAEELLASIFLPVQFTTHQASHLHKELQ